MPKDLSKAPPPPEPPPRPQHVCRVVLTPSQRELVRERRGRDLEFVEIPDDDLEFEQGMPERTPDDVVFFALLYAEEQNTWEKEYRDYLVQLAAWQDAEDDADEARIAAIEDELEQELETRQLAVEAFYAEEGKAMEAARGEAIEAWDPKGKKRKKMQGQ